KQDLDKRHVDTEKRNQEVQKIKHVETFYEKPPPGLIKEHEEKPEDCIPAEPGNEDARRFLAQAPTKGLWMPLGKEVKVMQCWRCKRYGHRTGDRECPFFIKGNQKLEQFRVAHEDPMYDLIRENKRNEKETRYVRDFVTSHTHTQSPWMQPEGKKLRNLHRSGFTEPFSAAHNKSRPFLQKTPNIPLPRA
ncbi:unnamed protein product, partial [Tetraodon nigroviridis]